MLHRKQQTYNQNRAFVTQIGDGDDFYVMVDDVNYYRSLIYDYLSDIHQPYLIKHDDTTFFINKKMVNYDKYKITIRIRFGGRCYIIMKIENTELLILLILKKSMKNS